MRETPLTVVERVAKGHNGLPVDLIPGMVVYRFWGTTYGCCNPAVEIPVSLAGSHEYPFHGVPRSSVVAR